MSDYLSFKLSDDFVTGYKNRKINWGFDIGGGNSLGELTYASKYSRIKEDGKKERWHETVRRCVEGMYSLQKDYCLHNRTPWNEAKAQHSAQDAYDRMFQFKWTPPGRGLANMGTRMVHEEKNSAPLYNCAAASTEGLSARSVQEAILPFMRAFEMSAYGIGVGFDTRGAGKLTIHQPTTLEEPFVVPDSREGWAESMGILLESFFFKNRPTIRYDYSLVRPQGTPLKRFGGSASGPEPLRKLHESVRRQLSNRDGQKITSRDIVDIMNLIGKAIQAGGARRSAMLSLGDPEDIDYINLKNWDLPHNQERMGPDGWAWTSNNSVYATSDTDLSTLVEAIAINGEPGVVWIDMMQKYRRTSDPMDNSDEKANLVNPCAEIPLEGKSFEVCNLSELYPTNHDSFDDFLRSMKYAYLYAKSVGLISTPWAETNEVVSRNRRLGVSITGIAEFVETRSWFEMRDWMDRGHSYLRALDKEYSAWLGVRESIRLATVKPAGSTSLIGYTTAGGHWPTTSGYFMRRQRFLASDSIVQALRDAGYHVEPDIGDPDQTVVVEFATRGIPIRSEREVSVWEKANLAALAQRYWADNAVSVTVSFDKDTEADQIAPLLRSLQGQLKTISFLPIDAKGTSYAQAPYEPLDELTAVDMMGSVSRINPSKMYDSEKEAEGEQFCSTDTCEIRTF